MKPLLFTLFLSLLSCGQRSQEFIQNEPEVVFRLGEASWYAGGCINFEASEHLRVDYMIPNDEFIKFSFWKGEKFIGSLYIGHDFSVKRPIEESGQVNGIKFDSYEDERGKHFILHLGFELNTYGNAFFGLFIMKGYESEMGVVLSSVRRGSSEDYPLDHNSFGDIPAEPIPRNIDSFVSKCNLRWDLGREYREGFDWVASLRTIWYDLGADWIPLEGEKGYPNAPERFKR